MTRLRKRCKMKQGFYTARELKKLTRRQGFCYDPPIRIARTVTIGRDVTIGMCNVITGSSVLEDGCCLGAGNVLHDVTVKKECVVRYTVAENCVFGEKCTVGPFAQCRNTHLGKGCRLGSFVQTKQTSWGDGTKAAHLAYVGDASLGRRVNVGCGTVFANYDGTRKYFTEVGDDCFLGCNSVLVAPRKIQNGCFVAAGTVLRRNLPCGTFVLQRVTAECKPNRNDQEKINEEKTNNENGS